MINGVEKQYPKANQSVIKKPNMGLKNLNATKIREDLVSKLSNKRIQNLFKEFEKNFAIYDSFAVAVSGGPDSLALAFLAKVYSVNTI